MRDGGGWRATRPLIGNWFVCPKQFRENARETARTKVEWIWKNRGGYGWTRWIWWIVVSAHLVRLADLEQIQPVGIPLVDDVAEVFAFLVPFGGGHRVER